MLVLLATALISAPQLDDLRCDFSNVGGPSVYVQDSENAEPFSFDGRRLVSVHQGSVSARVDIRNFDPLTRQWSTESSFLESGNRYAESVDLDGDVLVIGRAGPLAMGSSSDNDQAAEVRLYDASTNEWIVEDILRPPVLQSGAELGRNVKVSGGTIVMEHRDFNVPGAQNAGAVEVFERDAHGAWVYVTRLRAFPATPNGRFGFSMDLEGDRLIVGEPRAQGSGGINGRVHVFERDAGGTWQQVFTGGHPQTPGTGGFGFGQAVALHGDVAAVTTLSELPQAVQLMERTVSGWALGERLALETQGAAGIFTSSVDIDDDRLVVGWRNNVGGNLSINGVQASLFERESGGWSAPRHYLRPNYFPSTLRRFTAMLSGDVIALGWRASSGSGGIFQIDRQDANGNGQPDACEDLGSAICAGTPNSSGAAGELLAVGSASRALNDVVLSASSLPSQSFAMALSSGGVGSSPLGAGTLCLASNATLGRFVQQIASTGPFGTYAAVVDLDDVPVAAGVATISAGDTWHFQVWFRDRGTSNLSSAVSVTFE